MPNGLQVILHEDHTTPVVAVNLWYRVGSKNEKAGRTGFAHLFEHLMFQGSQHHDNEYFGPLEEIGAQLNGSTSEDRTNYYETVPSNGLERALWLEADRMGFLIPALTQAKLDNQRDVVKNERRQRVDNQPYGQSSEKLDEALYPDAHPYHHSVIGSMADLSAASLEDVSAFFRTYYAPNNASLCLAGDFKPEEAKALIAKDFGPIPRGPDVTQPKPEVPQRLDAPSCVTMTDRVALPKTELVWPTVPSGHPDEPALDMLAAVLGGLDKENRLYRALMYDRQLAAHVGAAHPTQMLAGTFQVSLYARPGQKPDELVKLADAEIARLKSDGPTEAEVRKAQNERESQFIVGTLQSMTTRADTLNQNNVMLGDPLAYKDELKKVFAVTPDDVKRVANKYLTADRIRLDVNPGPPTERAPEVAVDQSKQEPLKNPPVVAIKDDFDRSKMPEIGPTPKFTPPAVVAPEALEWTASADRRAAQPAGLDARPAGQGGRNPHAEGQGGACRADRRALDRGNQVARRLATGGRPSRDRRFDRRQRRPGVQHTQADHADQAYRAGARTLYRRVVAPRLPREGAAPAPAPASRRAEVTARPCLEGCRGGRLPEDSVQPGPPLRPPRSRHPEDGRGRLTRDDVSASPQAALPAE